MGLIDWFRSFMDADENVALDAKLSSDYSKLSYEMFALNVCVNLIASTLSLVEFQTKEKGEAVKSDKYYLFNIEPNKNTSAASFWRRVGEKIAIDGNCLVVKVNGQLYVAESFERVENALIDNTYRHVVLGTENSYELKDTFYENQVYYFSWNKLEIKKYAREIYSDLTKLIAASQDNYKMLTKLKILIKQDSTAPKTTQYQKDFEDLINEHLKRFLDPELNNAIPLGKGIMYEDVSRKNPGTSANVARETHEFFSDCIEMSALMLQVPPQLLKGEVAGLDDAMKIFMTTCIKPLIKVISDEINRKEYGVFWFKKGNRLFIDYTKIQYTNIKDIASSLEALTRIGANTINDNLESLGREAIGGELGGVRWMTKNYENIENFFEEVK